MEQFLSFMDSFLYNFSLVKLINLENHMGQKMYTRPPLEYLNDLSAWVTGVRDPESLPKLIVDTAERVIQAKASSLLLLDEDKQTLRFEITTGAKKDALKQFQVKVGEGLAGRVAQTGDPLLVKDVSSDSRWDQSISENIDFKTKSIACSPVNIDGNVVGVLQVIDRKDGFPLDENDLKMLNVFANVCAEALRSARRLEGTKRQNRELTEQVAEQHKIVGKSPVVRQAVADGLKVAKTKASVLIIGPSGTGKELLARMIHNQSARKEYPLVVLNCGALTETLLEDELFGHEKGAYTGANASKKGKFELADKGTLFLDEIGEMNLSMQTRLLRVLQDGTYYRVGGNQPVNVDVRIICATNRDIEKEVAANTFREDLYYRLNVVQIKIPALKERGNDILILARHFLNRFKLEQGRTDLDFATNTLQILQTHNWPGNIRELKNAIERAVIMCDGPLIYPEDLPFSSGSPAKPVNRYETLKEAVQAFKKDHIINTLHRVQGNRTRAAQKLEIQRTYLSRLISEFEIKEI